MFLGLFPCTMHSFKQRSKSLHKQYLTGTRIVHSEQKSTKISYMIFPNRYLSYSKTPQGIPNRKPARRFPGPIKRPFRRQKCRPHSRPFSGRMTGLRRPEREINTDTAERQPAAGQGFSGKAPQQEAESGPASARSAPAGAGPRLRPRQHLLRDLPAR